MTICELHAARRWLPFVAGLSAVFHVTVARAQAEDQATARALFAEARHLVKSGAYEAACPKFEAASRLYPGSGVLLNLADCFEHTNRLASAWAEFGEAASIAHRSNRTDDELEAKSRQAALEPRLQRLRVHVSHDVPTLLVKRDGKVVDRAAWDVPLPVDSGAHTISAEAEGRAPWTGSVTLTEAGVTATVEVPELRELAAPPAPVPPPRAEPPPPTPPAAPPPPAPLPRVDAPVSLSVTPAPEVVPYWTSRRIVAIAGGAIGLASAGAGTALAAAAKGEYDTARGEVGAAQRNDSVAAVRNGNIATGLIAGGAALVAGGTLLWLSAPRAPVTVEVHGAGARLSWGFW